jgi:hypothetical protein
MTKKSQASKHLINPHRDMVEGKLNEQIHCKHAFQSNFSQKAATRTQDSQKHYINCLNLGILALDFLCV